jgi:hypothetical protein
MIPRSPPVRIRGLYKKHRQALRATIVSFFVSRPWVFIISTVSHLFTLALIAVSSLALFYMIPYFIYCKPYAKVLFFIQTIKNMF